MKLTEQIAAAWATTKAYRLALLDKKCDEYDRLDKLHRINKEDLP